MQDLTIDLDGQVLNFRTAGIIIKNKHVLLHKNKKDSFWTLIGGRIQMGEDSKKAVEREFEEELGILAQAERLLWSVENFFPYQGRLFHEYSFIYLIKDVEDKLKGSGEVNAPESDDFHYEWIPLEKISELSLKPEFLMEKLRQIPGVTEHIIHKGI